MKKNNKTWKRPSDTDREFLYWMLIAIHHLAEEEASGELGFKNESAVSVLNCLSQHSIMKIIRLTLTELKNKGRILKEDERTIIVTEDE